MLERDYKLVFLPMAEDDLNEIVKYISQQLQNPACAVLVLNRIRDSIYQRIKAPESFQKFGSKKKRRDTYYRINVGKSYSVFYVVKGNVVEIRRILYSARDIESLLV